MDHLCFGSILSCGSSLGLRVRESPSAGPLPHLCCDMHKECPGSIQGQVAVASFLSDFFSSSPALGCYTLYIAINE